MNDATKGPWTYDETWALIKGPGGEEIAAIHCGQGDGARVNRNVALDNARLIAAAPELLEQLTALAFQLKSAGMIVPPNVSKAIAKATI